MDVVPFQILTYHLALENKADPDFPRNILKAVTLKPNRALVILVALLMTLITSVNQSLDICVCYLYLLQMKYMCLLLFN